MLDKCGHAGLRPVLATPTTTAEADPQTGADSVSVCGESVHKTAARRTAGDVRSRSLSRMRCRYSSTVL